jgi:Na+-transporting NADH:ubiquinone oxidoreductase subunit F
LGRRRRRAVLALTAAAGCRYHSFMQSRRATIVVNDGERVFLTDAGKPLLFALMAEGILVPSACGGRASCGQCKVRVLSETAGYGVKELPLVSESERARAVHLSCQLIVSGDMRIRIPEASLHARRFWARVAAIGELARDMREITFELEEPAGMRFKAGQYVQFLLPGTEESEQPIYRAYSLASSPSSPRRLAIVVGRVAGGVCSSYLFDELAPGARVALNGPFGEFFLRESDREILFVAGGSGMGSIHGMLADMADRALSRPAAFFFAAHEVADLFYLERMRELEKRLPRFRFVPVLSRPRAEDTWEGERGGIASSLARLLPPLTRHEAYLCGSPGMIDASIGALKSRGLAPERIYFDKFS